MLGMLHTIDFEGVESAELLGDLDVLSRHMCEAIVSSGLTQVGEPLTHRFHPQGVTLVVLLAQSHLAVHTWPELGLLMVDFFTCGDEAQGRAACEKLQQTVKCSRVVARSVPRRAEVHEALGHGEQRSFHVEDVVVRRRTALHDLEIVKTEGYGLSLFLDGKRQSSEVDEFIYHELLVHPAMLRHREPASIFIAGGAEGAVAREVFRHGSVSRVVQVEVDGAVVEACRAHLPWSGHSYADARLSLQLGDAQAWLASSSERFDVVLLDVPNAHQWAKTVANRLNDDGVVALPLGPIHPLTAEAFKVARATLRETFAHVLCFLAPELKEGFAVCSQTPFVRQPVLSSLRYYGAALHDALGALPAYLS